MGEIFAGRYELADPIGRGGVGAVWRAWDHRRRRYVAAKVLQQSDAHTLLRFVREQALRIDHPHVLAPVSWAADDDKVLFTMDLVGGGSLAHLIGDYGPLPPGYVCTLLDQLLSGLAAVHAERVVHRDIKPANILLEATGTKRPHLRLSDFGISMRKGEPRLTETDFVVGTPGYFAPEQMLGAEPDFPSDLYAVGLVALYLLQGAKPDAKALVERFRAQGIPHAPQGIPEPLWQVVANLLQPDPQARFRTATGARKALASAAEMLPEPGPDDELIEVFDQLGPLPPGFGPDGPVTKAPRSEPTVATGPTVSSGPAVTTGLTVSPAPAVPTGSTIDPGPAVPPSEAFANAETPAAAFLDADASKALVTPEADPGSEPVTPAGPAVHASPDAEVAGRHHPSMSETGSFPLTPPLQASPAPSSPSSPPSSPLPGLSAPPTAPMDLSGTPTASVQRDTAPTRSYTAPVPGVPAHGSAHGSAHGHAPANPYLPGTTPGADQLPYAPPQLPTRRPGPPAKVAIPVLAVAFICFAVGIWALSQI
ncbi:serine/threonine-protein kinase [Streptomyces himalayensis]|uniref:non-specific serine/threonine protein kinase n=1 Tax=Streptomyces himalayensis subsp. himalayensis TaxID=2756131 RepID=A0A7W0I7M5_9ACTN|nr:serine/threonine-protein kinase [Streptomyces himalayensis]MBA2945362.1 protein kinase [Streptomyces himalayensis subsp. himalayensis]